ncbi:hypothetical protein F5879DRAFT_921882 [Lentinula edodes]|nr:hypothetical protein F5879DRAFT_921882 [Lentinula edodes]
MYSLLEFTFAVIFWPTSLGSISQALCLINGHDLPVVKRATNPLTYNVLGVENLRQLEQKVKRVVATGRIPQYSYNPARNILVDKQRSLNDGDSDERRDAGSPNMKLEVPMEGKGERIRMYKLCDTRTEAICWQ